MDVIALTSLLLGLTSLAVTLTANAAALRLLHRQPGRGSDPPPRHPPVSILEPLEGIDQGRLEPLEAP